MKMQIQIKKNHKRYENFKHTRIQWLGDVPEGWIVSKLKYLASIQTGNTPSKTEEDNFSDLGFPWVKPDNLNDFEPLSHSKEMLSDKGILYARKIKKNSVLVCGIGTIGKIGVAGCELATNQQINSITFGNKIDEKYGQYLVFASKSEMERIANKVTVSIMNTGQQSNIFYCYPNKGEQMLITSYLDEKISFIEKIIKSKQKQIELLKEKRSALINRAVTKGVNAGVEMKDSGVQWIGRIPKHWQEKPLFACAYERKIKNIGNKIDKVLSLSYGQIVVRDIESNFGLLPESFETYQIVDAGDIILRLTDLQNDKKSLRVGLVKETGIITSAYVCLRAKASLLHDYFYELLHSYDIEKVFYSLGAGVRQTMKFEDLKRLSVLVPPKEEQSRIAQFINSETEKIDSAIIKIGQSIDLLREYKASLISNVVTGKIKVT